MRRRPRLALPVVVAIVSATTLATSHPAPARAAAAQVYPLPATGEVVFDGHGFGSGVGMSQWGAEGGAEEKLDWQQIVGFYYPGTSLATVANSTIRVLLTEASSAQLEVAPAAGLQASDGSASASLPSTGQAAFRAVAVSGGLQVQELGTAKGATWKPVAFSTKKTTVAGPVSFTGSSGTELELLADGGGGERYRGSLEAVATSASSLETIDALPLESYLDGVVPHEAVPSWDPAALQAQAVAARSYALYRAAQRRADGLPWDVTDTTADQVFEGPASVTPGGTVVTQDQPTTTAAVTATAGSVLDQDGAPIAAEYGASDGGWTVQDSYVSYLPAESDPYDGIPAGSTHSWTVSVPVGWVAQAAGLSSATALVVSSRDGHGTWGGRVLAMSVEGLTAGGATATVALDPGQFSADLGLLDTWWSVPDQDDSSRSAEATAPRFYTAPGPDTAVLSATLVNTGTASWPLSSLRLLPVSRGPDVPGVGPATVPAPVDLTHPGARAAAVGDSVKVSVDVSAAGLKAGHYYGDYQLSLSSGPAASAVTFGAVAEWNVRVTATRLAAAQVGSPGALTVAPHGTVSEVLSLRNTGNVAWPSRGLVRLAAVDEHGPSDPMRAPDWLTGTRVGPLLAPSGAASTVPGAVATVVLTLAGNGLPAGARTEHVRLVWEGAAFFGPVLAVPVTVT